MMKSTEANAAEYSRLAKEVLDTSLLVEPGDSVWIQGWDHTLDLAKDFAYECTARACPYLMSVKYEDIWLRSLRKRSKKELASVAPQEEAVLRETDFYIFTMGPRSPVHWDSIPEENRNEVSIWLDTRYDKSLYARKWAGIAKTSKVKMLGIEATLATQERATVLGLDHEEWQNVMLQGCATDHRAIATAARKLAKFMSGKGSLNITTPSGTRLAFDLCSRPVEVSDGISTNEMAKEGRIVFLPAGAIDVSVDEESAEGRIVYASPVRLGNDIIENLVLEVREGLVTNYSSTRGSEAFEQYLKLGGKDSGRFSYFGFGLNPNLRYGFTQDDKVLGGVTLGFGSNKSMGGKNTAKDQWWASITGATVKLDDVVLMAGGGKLPV